MNLASKLISKIKLFNPKPNLSFSPLIKLIEANNYANFPVINNWEEAQISSWFHVRTASKSGYAQISRTYSKKKKVPYVLNDEKIVSLLSKECGILVLDASYEGIKFWEHPVRDLHDNLSTLNISPNNIFYITSSYRWESDYHEWARNNNIDKPINVAQYNYYFANTVKLIIDRYSSKDTLEQHSRKFYETVHRKELRPKYFLCPNNAPRAHRIYTLLYLIKQSYFENGIISLPGLVGKGIEFPKENSGINLFPDSVRQLEKFLPTLNEKLPLTIDMVETELLDTGNSLMPIEPYLSSYFSILNESDFSSDKISSDRRFTEKVVQPLFNYHPFILVGSKGTLRLLKEWGFITFSPYIDESYDNIEDAGEKIMAIFNEIDRLCSMPKQDLHEMVQEMWPILDHNARLVTNLLDIIKVKYDTPLLMNLNKIQVQNNQNLK